MAPFSEHLTIVSLCNVIALLHIKTVLLSPFYSWGTEAQTHLLQVTRWQSRELSLSLPSCQLVP